MQELVLPILEETLHEIEAEAVKQPAPSLAVPRAAESEAPG